MIWAKVSSWSCFCWLYRTSPSLAAKNIINLISVLTIWWCPCIESSLVLLEEGVCYDQYIFLANSISLCPASFRIPRPNLPITPGEGNGTPLQYSCLENPMDGGAWWAAIYGVAQSWTQLSDFTFHLLFTSMHWRRKWQPTPVFLPGQSQGWGSLWAAVYGVAKSRTRLKRLSSSSSSSGLYWRLPRDKLRAIPCIAFGPWKRYLTCT